MVATSAMRYYQGLALELIEAIVKSVDYDSPTETTSTLATLSRTSRLLNSLTTRPLYRRPIYRTRRSFLLFVRTLIERPDLANLVNHLEIQHMPGEWSTLNPNDIPPEVDTYWNNTIESTSSGCPGHIHGEDLVSRWSEDDKCGRGHFNGSNGIIELSLLGRLCYNFETISSKCVDVNPWLNISTCPELPSIRTANLIYAPHPPSPFRQWGYGPTDGFLAVAQNIEQLNYFGLIGMPFVDGYHFEPIFNHPHVKVLTFSSCVLLGSRLRERLHQIGTPNLEVLEYSSGTFTEFPGLPHQLFSSLSSPYDVLDLHEIADWLDPEVYPNLRKVCLDLEEELEFWDVDVPEARRWNSEDVERLADKFKSRGIEFHYGKFESSAEPCLVPMCEALDNGS